MDQTELMIEINRQFAETNKKIETVNKAVAKLETEVALLNNNRKWIAGISGFIGSIIGLVISNYDKIIK